MKTLKMFPKLTFLRLKNGSWESGQWLMLPNEVSELLEISKNIDFNYAIERLTGLKTDFELRNVKLEIIYQEVEQ